jgi:hypothetical protein
MDREAPVSSGSGPVPAGDRDRFARGFHAIRREVLDRLVDVRGSIDHTLASVPSRLIRQEFDSVLDRMASYLVDQDVSRYRSFAARWVAFRLGEGFSPENLLHSVVAIGDVILETARSRLPHGQQEAAEFVREIARLNFMAARVIVEILAGELEVLKRTARRMR